MARIRIINGKGDWTDTPPTGADAHDLQSLSNDFIKNGGVVDLAGNDCLVEQSGTPGMSVRVRAGTVYVKNSSWTANSLQPKFFVVTRDSQDTVSPIASNASGSTRIDLICQKIDKVTTPNDDGSNVVPLVIVQGTPGSGAPATPNDHELLAEVSVASGASSITNANITDKRRLVDVKAYNPNIVTLTDGATVNLDASAGDTFYLLAAGNRTIAVPTNPVNGKRILILHRASGGARTLSLDTGAGGFKFGDDITALTATDNGETDVIGAIYSSVVGKWLVVAYAKGFA